MKQEIRCRVCDGVIINSDDLVVAGYGMSIFPQAIHYKCYGKVAAKTGGITLGRAINNPTVKTLSVISSVIIFLILLLTKSGLLISILVGLAPLLPTLFSYFVYERYFD